MLLPLHRDLRGEWFFGSRTRHVITIVVVVQRAKLWVSRGPLTGRAHDQPIASIKKEKILSRARCLIRHRLVDDNQAEVCVALGHNTIRMQMSGANGILCVDLIR